MVELPEGSEKHGLLNLADLSHGRPVYMAAMEDVQNDRENDDRSKHENRPVHVHGGRVVCGREEGEDDGKAKPKKRKHVNGQAQGTK